MVQNAALVDIGVFEPELTAVKRSCQEDKGFGRAARTVFSGWVCSCRGVQRREARWQRAGLLRVLRPVLAQDAVDRGVFNLPRPQGADQNSPVSCNPRSVRCAPLVS